MMKNKRFNDAMLLLQPYLQATAPADAAKETVLLGECLFQTQRFAEAKAAFGRALPSLKDANDKAIALFRIACADFRLGNHEETLKAAEVFLKHYPDDPRAGKTLVFKMSVLAAQKKDNQKELEALREQIQQGLGKYGYATGMEADGILGEFYKKRNLPEKAAELYNKIVFNFRNLIAECESAKRPIPEGLGKYHDQAALQLGIFSLDRKQADAAIRWLENVRYDPELVLKARLLLAKADYEQQQYARAQSRLLAEGFLEKVPEGPIRSDLYLLLGLAEKAKPDGSQGRVEEYLGRVGPDSKGYPQAQAALGDLYRDRKLTEQALKAYTATLGSPAFAPAGLYHLGCLHLELGEKASGKQEAEELFRKSSAFFNQLFTKYPLTGEAKQAKEKVLLLQQKGVDVSFAGDEEMVRAWVKTAEEKQGTVEAAQALASLIRQQARSVVDEQTKQVVQAPDYVRCAGYCDRLLDEKVYTGQGFVPETWRDLRAEISYQRALCELASLSPPPPSREGPAPNRLAQADLARAIACLVAAREGLAPARQELRKQVEFTLVEALFKSEKKEDKAQAERLFAELGTRCAGDPRLKKLTLELADWFGAQGRYLEAARALENMTEKGGDLGTEELLQAAWQCGLLYSRAAWEEQQKKGESVVALQIHPQVALQLKEDLLRTHKPFQKEILPKWPNLGRELQAGSALKLISQLSGIPFVWAKQKGPDTVTTYLETKRLNLVSEKKPVAHFLEQILDLQHQRLALDLGLTDGKPTLAADPAAAEDDEERDRKAIEIYDERQAARRYPFLQRPYGIFASVHNLSRGGALLHNILNRIESVSGAKVLWAEGVEREEKLALEYKQVPGLDPKKNPSCQQVLAAVLEAQGLGWRVVLRDSAADLYEKAKDAFNRIRKIDPKSRYGEKSLFALAINYYNQKDYKKMCIVLKEYLKLFDSPSCEFFHAACFWLGWSFEHERRWREACDYYSRAAEERLILYKLAAEEKLPAPEELKKRFSYDLLFNLGEPLSGEFKEYTLGRFLDFLKLNAHIEAELDPDAAASGGSIERPAFRGVSGFELLYEVLKALGLSARAVNIRPDVAEKALYRMALVYRKEELLPQALENLTLLLARFPKTSRRKEACALKLEIYKGLKDYRQVVAMLEELKALAGGDLEKQKLEQELADIHYDQCAYEKAAAIYKSALAQAKEAEERADLRDALARCYFRLNRHPEALAEYTLLQQEDPNPLRSYLNRLPLFYLQAASDPKAPRELPAESLKLIQTYERLSNAERERLSPADLVKATWVYYVSALIDLLQNQPLQALPKFLAASNSPDDLLAGEAALQAGMVHWKLQDAAKAREAFEYVLFSTKTAEAAVRATFLLGLCHEKLGQPEKARERFAQLLERYPLSPYAEQARAHLPPPPTEPKPAGPGAAPAGGPSAPAEKGPVQGVEGKVGEAAEAGGPRAPGGAAQDGEKR